MRAYVLTAEGPRLTEREPPKPGPTDVLVKVAAAALNRVDLAMTRGHVHGGAGGQGATLGVEWAGEVVETGAEAEGLKTGDLVMCSGAGAFAEYAVTDVGRAMKLPAGMKDLEAAAGLPVALQTMHDAIVTNGAFAAGQAVLIQGASSGVGIMGLKIARAMGAGLVIGSSTDPERRAMLSEHGADMAIDSKDPEWVAQVLEATAGKGVDLIVDQVSGPVANGNLKATKIKGRIVNVGRLGGDRAEFDFDLHAMRRISYVGVTFRTRSRVEVREITRRMAEDLSGFLAAGDLTLPVDCVFPLEEIEGALAHMRANRHFGKIVVRM